MSHNITEQTDHFITQELRDARLKANVNISDLAQTVCVSVEEYEAYESGKEPMPASIAYFVSIILTNKPYYDACEPLEGVTRDHITESVKNNSCT